jgi:hypothetical protein
MMATFTVHSMIFVLNVSKSWDILMELHWHWKQIDVGGMNKMEKIKDILKPIRRLAQEATGTEKDIYDEMLRQIDERCGRDATRQDVIDEIERQNRETTASLKKIEQQVKALDKGPWYVHWDEIGDDEE